MLHMTQSYEKHQTSTDALDSLGSIIGPDEKRDAIHLAVEPAVASVVLNPGQHVSIDPATNIASPAKTNQGVGIVDPFLTTSVGVGEQFWLVVYPRQINSLRHVWEHASFAPSTDLAPKVDAVDPAPATALRDKAEKWLREYAEKNFYIVGDGGENDGDIYGGYDDYGLSFDGFIGKFLNADDEYVHFSGMDASGEIPEELWANLETYVGHPIERRASYFSCSC